MDINNYLLVPGRVHKQPLSSFINAALVVTNFTAQLSGIIVKPGKRQKLRWRIKNQFFHTGETAMGIK